MYTPLKRETYNQPPVCENTLSRLKPFVINIALHRNLDYDCSYKVVAVSFNTLYYGKAPGD